jgi:hypothetical protein
MRRLLLLLVVAGCNAPPPISALDAQACTACHTNLTPAHTKALILCTDCHGQNTDSSDDRRADLLAEFKRTRARYGTGAYQELLDATHVRARQPEFFLANGQSNSIGACFNGATDPNCNFGDETRLGTVDDAIDSEYARDLDYVRFINPGDLRVAHASCGGGNPREGDYAGCHAEEVTRVRRSLMASNAAVVTAAFIGNRGASDARGYMFDYESARGIDSCWRKDQNRFDQACLNDPSRRVYPADDLTSAVAPENAAGTFQAYPGSIKSATDLTSTLPHGGWATRLAGVGGQMLDGSNQPHAELKAVDSKPLSSIDASLVNSSVCAAPVPASTNEPVAGVLRGFRAYYPLLLPGSGKNFDAIAGATLDPLASGIPAANAFNPWGRGHGSGCTGCHMLYANDGISREHEQRNGDPTLQQAGRFPHLDLVDRGAKGAQGMNVLQQTGFDDEKKQQRFYPSRHRLTSRIPTQQCGLCHTFVTRIDLGYSGIFEVEERDVLARAIPARPSSGDITFTTPNGTRVRIFDSQERVENKNGQLVVTTDSRAKDYRAKQQAECKRRNLDCDGLAIYSGDFNNNGELDGDEPDLSGNGELLLPDRVPRELSVDGRQARVLYGGANGSTHLKDVHLEKGMHCIDCHFYQDLHGDGNIYTTNWDHIEIECDDCHGLSVTRAFERERGKLLTSGPNGRNDLMKAKDEFGRAFFEVRKDQAGRERLFQRSRVTAGLEWEVKQVADSAAAPVDGNPDSSPHSDKHLPTRPGEPGQGRKLECYSCHNSFAMNCLSCHYQQNFVKGQAEVFLTGAHMSSKTNFQLFGMVRGPLILGVDGNAEQNRISPFRSSMEAFVSVADCNGDTLAAKVTHSNCRSGKPTSGIGMNNFMPHSVRRETVRDCDTCHTATDAQGRFTNNHILAQTMGLGTGRLTDVGDFLFVASNGDARPTALDVVDIKNESELPKGETSAKNSFPGFIIGNQSDSGAAPRALLRSFGLRANPINLNFVPRDVALVRGWNGNLCTQEKLLNPDIAIVAAGLAGVQVFDVSAPDSKDFLTAGVLPASSSVALPAGANVVGLDHLGPDIADPIVYLADQAAGFETLDLTGFDPATNGPTIDPTKVKKTTGWPAGAPALGVRVMGTVAAVASGTAGLILVDVSNPAAPKTIGTPVPACQLGDPMPCTRSASRVVVQGTVAYLATSSGVVAVDVSNVNAPRVLSVLPTTVAVEDLAISGHLLFAASGTQGLKIIDVTTPIAPTLLTKPLFTDANGGTLSPPINEAHGVVIGVVPTQTWAFVADGTHGVRAVNISTLFDPYRGRPGSTPAPIAADHVKLTLESRDPFTPRDTTVFTDDLPVLTFPTRGSAHTIARGMMLDRITDESGRRLRDSWNPGNSVLSRATMDRMRAQSYRISK